ncbi:hypothetical protein M231_04627 [Tremella mesenterica]|uniref:Uncharacterized protein n=1 Tax=Tremella mesenterica TaxID=5217 RepID=A0A4Q1BJZ5_TREME|nr:hypothetical protein M231_04627 [Tremella mesenterica]
MTDGEDGLHHTRTRRTAHLCGIPILPAGHEDDLLCMQCGWIRPLRANEPMPDLGVLGEHTVGIITIEESYGPPGFGLKEDGGIDIAGRNDKRKMHMLFVRDRLWHIFHVRGSGGMM